MFDEGGAKQMSDRVYAQDEIFAAVRLLKKYHAERAILFGSYARQEADATSDIDLIVIGGSRFTPTDVFCIAEELRYAVRHLGSGRDLFTDRYGGNRTAAEGMNGGRNSRMEIGGMA